MKKNNGNGTKKKVLCLFSGGLDSTYMVELALKKNYEVTLLHIDLSQGDRSVYEKNAVDNVVKYFNDEYPDSSIKVVSVKTEFDRNIKPLIYFAQMPFWITYPLYYANECDEVWIGYVMCDQAISYLDDIRKIWNSFKRISHEDRYPKLIFPLCKISKEMIRYDMDYDLFQLTVYCESPVDVKGKLTPCGECPSCKRAELSNVLTSNHYASKSLGGNKVYSTESKMESIEYAG